MGSGLLGISLSGLNAAQMGILTTSHNIANASTTGYNRQTIVQSTNTPTFSGAGFLGQGVIVDTVRRVYSEFLTTQVKNAETNAAELNTYATQLAQIDNLLADPSAGLSPALQGFFSAVSAAASDPASVPSRQALLSASQALVARFHGLDQQLVSMRDGVNNQLRAEVGTINSYVNQIAEINQRIVSAQAAGASQPANDLYDQRDQLISDLNKEIRITTHQETDGSYSIFFGSGQPLVIGTQVYTMQAAADREDLTNVQIGLKSPNGSVMSIPESLVTGGNIGGLLTFRSNTLNSAQNAIGRVALALATDFNAQHALGQDLNGDLGGNFFQPIKLSIMGAPVNTGNASITATVTASDYMVSFSASSGYTITRLADDAHIGTYAGLPQVVEGVRISLAAGTPADGDSFLVKPQLAVTDRVVAFATNQGSATLASTGSNIQTMTDSDYRLTLTGTNMLTLERLSDHQTWVGTGSTQAKAIADLMAKATPQGFDLSISGMALTGDSFLIRPARTAARDIALAVNDVRAIALGAPIRTSASLTNAGTAAISPGVVDDTSVLQQAPFTIRYEAASASFVGFPVGSKVVVGSITYNITDAATRVPYVPGTNIGLNGIGAVITGTPADGDVFTIGANMQPAIAPPAVGNTGFATLFGMPTNTAGVAANPGPPVVAAQAGYSTGGISLSNPTVVTAGVDNKFMLSVDGAVAVSVTIAAGSYAPTSAPGGLVNAVQTAIDAALGPGAATVSVDALNRLVVTSTTSGAASTISLSHFGNIGTATITAGNLTSRASLPAAPITLTYHQATVSPSTVERLTGFPVGSIVTVTPPGGKPTRYTISQSDDAVPYISEATVAFNGMSFSISGPAVDGDTFIVEPNPAGVADNRNAALLGALQTRNTMSDATSTYQGSYAVTVSRIGNKAREVEVTLAAQEKLVTQGNDAIQSQSGVNLDEEAANLLRYQQAYQAAAKIINISGKLFDSLLELGY